MYTALDKLANLQCMQCLASSDREESVYKEHNLIVHSALLVLIRVRCSDKVWQYICLHTYAVHHAALPFTLSLGAGCHRAFAEMSSPSRLLV